MQYTISVYDENGNCKVCREHVSKFHADGCEVGALRKALSAAQQSARRIQTGKPKTGKSRVVSYRLKADQEKLLDERGETFVQFVDRAFIRERTG